MNIQFLPLHDSDSDSWLEVLEGSPGPSLPASPTFQSMTSTESPLFELEVTDSTSESDGIPASDESSDESDSESDSNPNSHLQQSLTLYSSAEQNLPSPIDIRLPQQVPFQSLLDKPLNLDHPEIGDIIRHFHEVYGKYLNRSDETDYYQSWLSWMYCMTWNQIWLLVSRAPDCVVHAANHLFGLRNHPFWSGINGYQREWHAMHAACRDILTWWKDNRLDGEPHRNSSTTGSDSARNTFVFSAATPSDEIELYYGLSIPQEDQVTEDSASHRERIVNEDLLPLIERRIAEYEQMQKGPKNDPTESHDTESPFLSPYSSIQTLTDTKEDKLAAHSEQMETPRAPPWPPHQVVNYIISKYQCFDRRSYEEVDSYEIPFETWVHWNQHMHKNRV
ncbi:uncharacterized protein TRUGW13939_07421 [Talaromyces rugulosus]|uniref:Uncharacterized protein n=1 Tax=Talaromyces rugulosus TaxID=121627 RepID=A0A7H8R2N2_TALRU|nr:uncharacterized protein TRUGW13939_07421 [Talaromyces rugulosus]QKX60278.1 hypothetical protein TRUGW13939_07421 [Talaromyces rugulosus]